MALKSTKKPRFRRHIHRWDYLSSTLPMLPKNVVCDFNKLSEIHGSDVFHALFCSECGAVGKRNALAGWHIKLVSKDEAQGLQSTAAQIRDYIHSLITEVV